MTICKFSSKPTPKVARNNKPNPPLDLRDYEKNFPKAVWEWKLELAEEIREYFFPNLTKHYLDTKTREPKVLNSTPKCGNRNTYVAANKEYGLALGPDPGKIGFLGTNITSTNYSKAAYAEYKMALGPDPKPFSICTSETKPSSKILFHSELREGFTEESKCSGATYKHGSSNPTNLNSELSNKKFTSSAAATQRKEPIINKPLASILDNIVNSSSQRYKTSSSNDEPPFLAINARKIAEKKAMIQNAEYEKEWRARSQLEARVQIEKYEKKIKEQRRLSEIEKTCSYLKLKPTVQREPSCQEKIREVHQQKMQETEWMDPEHFLPPNDNEDGEFMNIPKAPFEIYNGFPPTRRENTGIKPNLKTDKAENCRNTIPSYIRKVYGHLKQTYSKDIPLPGSKVSMNDQLDNDDPRVQVNDADTSPPPENSSDENEPLRTDTTTQDPPLTTYTSQDSFPTRNDMSPENAEIQELETSCYMSVMQAILQNERIITSFYTEELCSNFKNCSICIISSEIKQQQSDEYVQAEPGYEATLFCKKLYNRHKEAEDLLYTILENMESDKAKYHPKLAKASAIYGSFEFNILCPNCAEISVVNGTCGPFRFNVSAETPGRVDEKVKALLESGDEVKHKCLHCHVTASSKRRTLFTALPEVVFVVADRFLDQNHKSMSPIHPSPEITLRNKNGAAFTYRLTSIISHQGTCVQNGLYYTSSADDENAIDSLIYLYTNSNIEATPHIMENSENPKKPDGASASLPQGAEDLGAWGGQGDPSQAVAALMAPNSNPRPTTRQQPSPRYEFGLQQQQNVPSPQHPSRTASTSGITLATPTIPTSSTTTIPSGRQTRQQLYNLKKQNVPSHPQPNHTASTSGITLTTATIPTGRQTRQQLYNLQQQNVPSLPQPNHTASTSGITLTTPTIPTSSTTIPTGRPTMQQLYNLQQQNPRTHGTSIQRHVEWMVGLSSQNEHLRRENEELRSTLSRLTAENSALESSKSENRALRTQCSDLESQLSSSLESNQELRQENQWLENIIERLRRLSSSTSPSSQSSPGTPASVTSPLSPSTETLEEKFRRVVLQLLEEGVREIRRQETTTNLFKKDLCYRIFHAMTGTAREVEMSHVNYLSLGVIDWWPMLMGEVNFFQLQPLGTNARFRDFLVHFITNFYSDEDNAEQERLFERYMSTMAPKGDQSWPRQ